MIFIGLCIGVIAGLLGAILGLGGGIVVVPALTFVLPYFGQQVTMAQIIAVSQVGVLAVGLSGAAAYLGRGLVQQRIGYLLSPYTVFGGVLGSLLGVILPASYVALVFALLLFYSAYSLLRGTRQREEKVVTFSLLVRPAMAFAGLMSGLLGIGGGTVQVPVMNLMLGLPIREAIATSTFIMSLTAVGNVLVYQASGLLDIHLAGTLALGILIGARLGAGLQQRIPVLQLKFFFALLLLFTACQLLWKYWF